MKAEVKRPVSLKIGYITFTVEYLDNEEWDKRKIDAADGGQMDGAMASIVVRDTPEQADIHVKEILLHEILHACVYVSGLVFENHRTLLDIEETFVARISPTLLDVFRVNPGLHEYLVSA